MICKCIIYLIYILGSGNHTPDKEPLLNSTTAKRQLIQSKEEDAAAKRSRAGEENSICQEQVGMW